MTEEKKLSRMEIIFPLDHGGNDSIHTITHMKFRQQWGIITIVMIIIILILMKAMLGLQNDMHYAF